MENRIQEYYDASMEQASDLVESQPLASVAVAFGIGLALGLVAVNLFSGDDSRRRSWMDNDWSAAQLGRQLKERLASMAPSSWTG